MTQEKIAFRPVKSTDFKALEDIIRITWNYDGFCSPKTAKRLSHAYLRSCLCNQTFTMVALKNDKPIGIIMGLNRKKKHFSLKYSFSQCLSCLNLLIRKEDRAVIKVFGKFNTIDKNLLKESNINFEGELAFFAVDERERGLGIGKKLFKSVQNYMTKEGIYNFFLYTDSTCNFPFYEKQGMKRLGQKIYSLKPYREEKIHFYIYGYEF